MIPRPQQPRNERMKLIASALYTGTIAESRVIVLPNNHAIVEVRLEGHRYGKPRIAIPRMVFIQTWNQTRAPDEVELYAYSHIDRSQSACLQTTIQGCGCVVRIQNHLMDGHRSLWSHEVMEVYP